MMPRVAGVPTRLLVMDIGVLATVPIVLAAIHFGAPSAFETFAFHHAEFRVYTLLTSAYVHTSDAHLYSNLVTYTLVIGFPYLLSLATDGRRWFYRVALALLVALPVFTSLTNYLVLGVYADAVPVTFGFSPIVAGLIGLYIISITRLVAHRYTAGLAGLTGLGFGLGIIQLVAVRYDLRLTVVTVAAIIATGVALTRHDTTWDCELPGVDALRNRTVAVDVVFLAVLTVTAAVFLLWLFPAPTQVVGDTGVINVVGHATGLACGLVIGLIALQMEPSPTVLPFVLPSRHSHR